MADNKNFKDASGTTFVSGCKDVSSVFYRQVIVVDPTAAYSQATMDAAARAGYVYVTNGTQTMPTMDAVGRAGFVKVTDGTNTQPTGDAVARRMYVQHTDGTNSTPSMDAAGRPGFQKITDGTNTLPTMDAVGRAGFVKVTDGTNTQPTGDAVARRMYVQHTDGTNSTPSMDATGRPGYVALTGVAANGLSLGTALNLAATVTAIKASAGTLYGLQITNTHSGTQYVQVFDVAAGSVTLGTTTPNLTYAVPTAATVSIPLPAAGATFGTAISVAATTTATGSSGATASTMHVMAQYK